MPTAVPCTRAVYHGDEGLVLTGRSMDFSVPIDTNLWVFPRGMERTTDAGPNPVRWTSRYGSIVAGAYDFSSSDGLNERGLAANLLWLGNAGFPEPSDRPALAVSAWVQYFLDNFATVEEAVAFFRDDPFDVVTDEIPGQGRLAVLHLSISDASGDSAIFEYIDGELQIHHSREYRVMTNEPPFAQQLALVGYWQQVGGAVFLPGTNRAADRFVRASFYIDAVPRHADAAIAVPIVMSVMRNTSVPYGFTTPDRPNNSTTRWRVVIDHTNLVYHYEDALAPGQLHVRLADLDLSEGAPVRKLQLVGETQPLGDAAGLFVPAEPFPFLGLQRARR
ncbi:MAG: linear amide C-N hydrolase [Deltaproteobacteria bacterium]|nr:MAG: linear amide C-N hydrolase [Deltaproteobacteria bacterium]